MDIQIGLCHPHSVQHVQHRYGGVRRGPAGGGAVGGADPGLHGRFPVYAGGPGGHAGGDGPGAPGGAVAPVLCGAAHHDRAEYRDFRDRLRADDRDIYAHQFSAPPCGDPGKPGAGRGRAELSPFPVRRGLPGDADTGMRGDLRGAHSEYRRGGRPHRGDMGHHRLYGAAVLLPVQNGEYRPERPGGALK